MTGVQTCALPDLEKASGQVREQLLAAMEMPIETEEQKAAKIAAVKDIYAALEVGEEAKQEIERLHGQAMNYIAQLGLPQEKADMLVNYAKKLIGRTK